MWPPQTGKQHDEECFASDMRLLDHGVWIDIPDDANPGRTVRVRLKGFASVSLSSTSLPNFQSPAPVSRAITVCVSMTR